MKTVYCHSELWFCRERTCLSISLDLFSVHWKLKKRLTSSVVFLLSLLFSNIFEMYQTLVQRPFSSKISTSSVRLQRMSLKF